jgi:hypothetical protein
LAQPLGPSKIDKKKKNLGTLNQGRRVNKAPRF